MIWGKCEMNIGDKYEFWQSCFGFTLINQLNKQKRTCRRNYKSCCNLPLMETFLTPLMKLYTSPERHKKKGSGLD